MQIPYSFDPKTCAPWDLLIFEASGDPTEIGGGQFEQVFFAAWQHHVYEAQRDSIYLFAADGRVYDTRAAAAKLVAARDVA